MKLTANKVLEHAQILEPTAQFGRPHACVSTLLRIPINGKRWVRGREVRVGPSRMIVNGPQTAHCTVRYVRSVLFGDLVMAFGDKLWLPSKSSERFVYPVVKQSLHVITIVLDGPFASSFSDHVDVTIALPCLAQSNRALSYRCIFSGSLAFGDSSQNILGFGPRFPRRDVAELRDLLPGGKLADTVAPECALRHILKKPAPGVFSYQRDLGCICVLTTGQNRKACHMNFE